MSQNSQANITSAIQFRTLLTTLDCLPSCSVFGLSFANSLEITTLLDALFTVLATIVANLLKSTGTELDPFRMASEILFKVEAIES